MKKVVQLSFTDIRIITTHNNSNNNTQTDIGKFCNRHKFKPFFCIILSPFSPIVYIRPIVYIEG